MSIAYQAYSLVVDQHMYFDGRCQYLIENCGRCKTDIKDISLFNSKKANNTSTAAANTFI